MGTRADFYIGRGLTAEWLGSIAWDGYPEGIDKAVLGAMTDSDFRSALTVFFANRNDVSFPEDGWPWPWEDSQTTDYAYAFDGGKVYGSCFGHSWFDPLVANEDDDDNPEKVPFPDMTAKKNVQWGVKSGLIVIKG